MKTKPLASFCFGNHNTPNAVEDYTYFVQKALESSGIRTSITRQIPSTQAILALQEDFDKKEVRSIERFKKINPKSKIIFIATENIEGDSFNDIFELNKILAKAPFLEELGRNQIKTENLPKYLFNKYISRLMRDLQGFHNIHNRIRHDHLGGLHRRYLNFLRVAPLADQIWLMPGLTMVPYTKLFGDKIKPFPFVLSPAKQRHSDAITFGVLLSGKISPHRRGLLNYLGMKEAGGILAESPSEHEVVTSSFDIPLSIRREMLKTVGVYLDLPVAEGSQIFSSIKAAVALEGGIPFFALSQADPGMFAPFVRTFPDIHSLKRVLESHRREDFVEMGAHFSAEAAKAFTPSAYPFLEELLK